ncbi:MAG: LolA family protein [Pseudomonas sp.]
MADPLAEAMIRFRALNTYQVTLRSVAADGERQVIRYYYRKPGWVRMEFVQPHGGAVLIYDPDTRRVRLWPLGLKHTLALTFAPNNPLVRGSRGHRADRSDVGALLENLLALRARGNASPLGEADLAARPTVGFDIVGAAGVTVAGVHRYQVWLAQDTLFPLRVKSFEASGYPIETVDMTEVETDVHFSEGFFTP